MSAHRLGIGDAGVSGAKSGTRERAPLFGARARAPPIYSPRGSIF